MNSSIVSYVHSHEKRINTILENILNFRRDNTCFGISAILKKSSGHGIDIGEDLGCGNQSIRQCAAGPVIDYNWLNQSFESFKVKCKSIFLN